MYKWKFPDCMNPNGVYNNYLAHHGIKGQKWGVKNGPPYPLDEQSEGRNAEFEKKVNKILKKFVNGDFDENDVTYSRFKHKYSNAKNPIRGLMEGIIAMDSFSKGLDYNEYDNTYVYTVKTGALNNALALAVSKMDGDFIDTAVYFKEGSIKQNGGSKAIEKIKKGLS